jgi:uncharacterized iron-regulated protein
VRLLPARAAAALPVVAALALGACTARRAPTFRSAASPAGAAFAPGAFPAARTRPVPGAPSPRAAVRSAPREAPGAILDHRTGRTTSFDAMADRLATAAVVCVGEDHDQAKHHAFQARVLEALADRWRGKPVALGLEMFSRPFQPALDAYVRGEIDEAAMLERTEWAKRWGFGWEMYAPMLRLCRARGIPVLALNAEKEVTRTVSRGGLEALTPEQRASLPPLDASDAGHRAFVKEAFGAHGASMPAERFERFYLAMVIWDEVMSTTAADWLAANGPESRVVVVAGNGHVADRWGIPSRAARKSGRAAMVVVQRTLAPEPAAGDAPAEARTAEEAAAEAAAASRRWTTAHADYSVAWEPSAPPKPAHPRAAAAPAKAGAKPEPQAAGGAAPAPPTPATAPAPAR